jgi:hypothetical protein
MSSEVSIWTSAGPSTETASTPPSAPGQLHALNTPSGPQACIPDPPPGHGHADTCPAVQRVGDGVEAQATRPMAKARTDRMTERYRRTRPRGYAP